MLRRSVGLLAIFAVSISAQSAGVQASVSAQGTQYVLNTLVPIIESMLATITIPDVSGEKDGFDYSLHSVVCKGFSIGSATVDMSSSAGVGVSLANIDIACTGDWSFKLHSWPHIPSGSGSVDVTVSSTSATLTVVPTEVTNHLQLTPENVAINIGTFDISFHGSLWDWLLDIFKGLIEDGIKKAVEDSFGGAIDDFINKDLNPKLAAIVMDVPLHIRQPYNISEVRFGLTANPTVTSTYMGVPLQGDVVPIANPVTPPITPPSLPAFNPASAAYYLQMQLSSYTLASAVYTYVHAGLTDWYFESDKIPLGFNTTNAYTLIAPQLPALYPGGSVSIEISISDMPNISFSATGVSISAPIIFSFLVTPTNGPITSAFTLNAVAQLGADLTIGKDSNGTMALMGKLYYLDADLSVFNTTVGTVNAVLLQDLINTMFSTIVVPLVNTIFGNGIPFPMVGGLQLTNTTIAYGSGYMTLASNFIFTPTGLGLHVPPARLAIEDRHYLRRLL